jgi:TolB-like protein
MKRRANVIVLCLLVSVSLATGQNTTGPSSTQLSKSSVLLKTDPNDVIVREVVGRGRTRDLAIKDALYRAVEQSRGVRVDSATYDFGFRSSGAGFSTDVTGDRRIEVDSIDLATRGTIYTTDIAGLVKSYDVLDEKQLDEKTYEVRIKASVYDYGVRGQTKRVKIALMPVKTQDSTYRFLNNAVSGDRLSALFTQLLAAGLIQTNKFAVLDRESIIDFAEERQMLVSFDAPLSEQAKLAETIGADYLLIGTITQAEIEIIERYLEVAKFTSRRYKARFNINYRLVDSATKQVVVASTVEKYLEDEEVRNLADEEDPTQWDSQQVRDAFLSLIAGKVIEAIIDRVYPVSVAAATADGQIVLNQGGDRISTGMQFDVFSQGEAIIDPDTGESLGSVETLLATLEVTRVTHTMSFARMMSGDASKLTRGLVCRPRPQKATQEPGVKPNIIKTHSGGVILPFDKK